MLAWTTGGTAGAKGIGTLMEAFPLDTVTGDFLHPDIRLTARDVT